MSIIISVLLVLVILAQNSKGGGLSSQFGGSSASNLIGVKKTSDLLEKLTWGLAIVLLVLSLSTNFITSQPEEGPTSPSLERAQEEIPGGFDNSSIPPPPVSDDESSSGDQELLPNEAEDQ